MRRQAEIISYTPYPVRGKAQCFLKPNFADGKALNFQMKYHLSDYVKLLEDNGLLISAKISADPEISDVSYNSKQVGGGTLFICKGSHFKEEYLTSAVEQGAVCYISEEEKSAECDFLLVNDIRKSTALVADMFYGQVWKKLNLTGITGTKGKSTTAYFIKYILDEYLVSEKKSLSAIISSIDTYDGVTNTESRLTTPEPIELHRHFKNAVDSNIEYLTMEVSSQALKYHRVTGVTFDVGCFLNIGEDHISDIEHPDFEDYFSSKLKIFAQSRYACVCLDSMYPERILAAAQTCEKVITFSTQDESADVYAYDIRKKGHDTSFMVRMPGYEGEFVLTIPGLFNVQNALAAISVCYLYGIPAECMYVGLMKARSSGRMEVYSNSDSKIIVIVDYAHNKMSFETLFNSVRKEFPGRKISIVFGCPGKKAIMRRRDLGTAAGKYADKVYITEEDFGEEPLMKICSEIADFVKQQDCPYEIIPDRGDAIKKAIADTDGQSVILVTGKGNETRLKRGNVYEPCLTDVEYTKKYLKEYDVLHNIDSAEKISSFRDILPALRKLCNKNILIKLGGSIMEDNALLKNVFDDIALMNTLGARIVVVHGGGKKISAELARRGIESRFVNGYRVTGEDSVETIEMVLSGNVNKRIVQELQNDNVNAIGLSGKDAGLICAKKKVIPGADIGFAGEITGVNPAVVSLLLDNGYLPVISPVSADTQGKTLNINADDAALAVAESLKVDTLVFITDVDGILLDVHNDKTVVNYVDIKQAEELIEKGFVDGGMLPKLKSCVESIRNGVNEVVILNGKVKYNLVSNFITPKKIGTTIGR